MLTSNLEEASNHLRPTDMRGTGVTEAGTEIPHLRGSALQDFSKQSIAPRPLPTTRSVLRISFRISATVC